MKLFGLIFGGIVAIFGIGLCAGWRFPLHHFEYIPSSHYLYDTSTGHTCDFWPIQEDTSGTDANGFQWKRPGNGQSAKLPTYLDGIRNGTIPAVPPCEK